MSFDWEGEEYLAFKYTGFDQIVNTARVSWVDS